MTRGLNLRQCRLCDSAISYRFKKKVLGKYDVEYFECLGCSSLQTEHPYWLEEAYSGGNLSNLDTGVAQRNIRNLAACLVIVKLYSLRNVIDFGGGDGLLCRLLRDYEVNCFVKDPYSEKKYAQGFTEQNFQDTDLIVSFEVLEHLPQPKIALEDLFSFKPKLLLVTTDRWHQQPNNWWYLMPESGQHVFFYSNKALEEIAVKYKYKLLICGCYILFIKNISPFRTPITKFLLKGKILRLIAALIVMMPAKGVWRDHILQKENLR